MTAATTEQSAPAEMRLIKEPFSIPLSILSFMVFALSFEVDRTLISICFLCPAKVNRIRCLTRRPLQAPPLFLMKHRPRKFSQSHVNCGDHFSSPHRHLLNLDPPVTNDNSFLSIKPDQQYPDRAKHMQRSWLHLRALLLSSRTLIEKNVALLRAGTAQRCDAF